MLEISDRLGGWSQTVRIHIGDDLKLIGAALDGSRRVARAKRDYFKKWLHSG